MHPDRTTTRTYWSVPGPCRSVHWISMARTTSSKILTHFKSIRVNTVAGETTVAPGQRLTKKPTQPL